jgi:coatomer subunit beta'
VKVWDYQARTCVQTLEGHTDNVSCIAIHPSLPVILSGSEDHTIRAWHTNTYRLETTLSYGHKRAWALCCLKGMCHFFISPISSHRDENILLV